ncbi:MAG: cbb3-type cytochrome c oxidase subunit II, partial [Ferruginibacter sp.]
IGPDLAREGTGNLKKSDGWHFRHFREPSSMSEGSIMPAYPFLLTQNIDTASTASKINAMRSLGVPYEKGYGKQANQDLLAQANGIRINLKIEGIEVPANREVIALIAYMQRLGKDISKNSSPTFNK